MDFLNLPDLVLVYPDPCFCSGFDFYPCLNFLADFQDWILQYLPEDYLDLQYSVLDSDWAFDWDLAFGLDLEVCFLYFVVVDLALGLAAAEVLQGCSDCPDFRKHLVPDLVWVDSVFAG